MRWIWAAFLALHAAAAQAPGVRDTSRDIFNEIQRSVQELTEISGFRLHRRIPYGLISREDVNRFLKQRVKEAVKPDDIRAEEITLKKFGLVPQDFDLAKTTVDLLTEQAAAFYDYNKKKLYITDWTNSDSRDAVLVHELAHGLADQNFDLGRYIKQARKSDDASLARMAVMEGQASWLMSEFLARKTGQSLKTSPALARMMARGDMAGSYPVFDQSPLYLRETLIFPYTKGLLFQQALVEKRDRQGFAEPFHDPPVSTQQIIHPEKYFTRVKPSMPDLPSFERKGYKRFAEGTLGELDHAILIEQFSDKDTAAKLAAHWRGGQYALAECKRENRMVLQYSSEWDDPGVARDFFGFYRQAMQKKWKTMTVTAEAEGRVDGTGDDGHFLLRLQGSVVTSLEGMPEALR
jgi:hypothetical protein